MAPNPTDLLASVDPSERAAMATLLALEELAHSDEDFDAREGALITARDLYVSSVMCPDFQCSVEAKCPASSGEHSDRADRENPSTSCLPFPSPSSTAPIIAGPRLGQH